MSRSLLLRDAEIDGARRADIRVTDGRIAQAAPTLGPAVGEQVIDCAGGAVLPGLCDHHLHLHAMAAAMTSVRCGPPEVRDTGALSAALSQAVPDAAGWIRGTGYYESVTGDLDAAALDRLRADRPVRVQHRSGALWILNTAALTETGLADGSASHPGAERDAEGRPTGRLWRADDWLRDRLARRHPQPRSLPSLASVGSQLSGFGITAATDATPGLDEAAIASISAAIRQGQLPPRVQLLGVPLGGSVPQTPGLTIGPHKIVLADSGMLTYPELAAQVAAAHGEGRAVAVHCVTLEALVLLVAVLREVGTARGDRVEHAGIVPREMVGELALLGVRVVTQPGFLADRGDDFLDSLPEAEHGDLYRCGSLLRARVPVALSSDAPYGPADPWAVVRAAVARQTPAGRVVGPGDQLTPRQALDAYLGAVDDPGGAPRQVRPGETADLILLHAPLAEALSTPAPVRMVLTANPPSAPA
ncbi:MAG TPA: amidohydrolase family protein [Trebonia sp.]|nr:amidohydrolase family protein [Trebonia sp.]